MVSVLCIRPEQNEFYEDQTYQRRYSFAVDHHRHCVRGMVLRHPHPAHNTAGGCGIRANAQVEGVHVGTAACLALGSGMAGRRYAE